MSILNSNLIIRIVQISVIITGTVVPTQVAVL